MRKRDIYSNYKQYETEKPYDVMLNPTEGDALRDREATLDKFDEATIASEPVLGAENQPVPRETVLPELVLDESLFEEDVTPKFIFDEGYTYKVDAHSTDGQSVYFETSSLMESWEDFKGSDEGSVFVEECSENARIDVRVLKYDGNAIDEHFSFHNPNTLTEGRQPEDVDYITVGDEVFHIRKKFGKLKAISYKNEYWVPYERTLNLEQNEENLIKEIEKHQSEENDITNQFEGLCTDCSESEDDIDKITVFNIQWDCDSEYLPKSLILGVEDYTNEEEFKQMVFDVLSDMYGCEIVSFDYDQETLPEHVNEELVSPEEDDKQQLRDVFTAYGFDIEGEGENLLGGYHFQIIKPDCQFEKTEEVKSLIMAMMDEFDDLGDTLGCPITSNFGWNDEGIITAGVDIHKKYVEDDSENVAKDDIETDDELEISMDDDTSVDEPINEARLNPKDKDSIENFIRKVMDRKHMGYDAADHFTRDVRNRRNGASWAKVIADVCSDKEMFDFKNLMGVSPFDESLEEAYRDSDIEVGKELKILFDNEITPITIVEVGEKNRDGSQKVIFEINNKKKQMWMKDLLDLINKSDEE